MFLLSSSEKGISSNQLHRTSGVTLKTAWFMPHRIREAMRTDGFEPMGGAGAIVEADETCFGDKELVNNPSIVAIVERGGKARTFHEDRSDKVSVTKIVSDNLDRAAHFMTDECRLYSDASAHVSAQVTINHARGEYVRGDVSNNTVEGRFSIFKRGMKGVYWHCCEKHLHRYLCEDDFRYDKRVALGANAIVRTDQAIKGIVGKRLTYQTIN